MWGIVELKYVEHMGILQTYVRIVPPKMDLPTTNKDQFITGPEMGTRSLGAMAMGESNLGLYKAVLPW